MSAEYMRTHPTDRREVSLPEGTILVLATEGFLDAIRTRDAEGRSLSIEIGEPEPEGWYVPTVTATDDEGTQDLRDGRALRRLREASGWAGGIHIYHDYPNVVSVYVGYADDPVASGSAVTIAEAADKCREALG